MDRFQAALFDLDGTLVDSEPQYTRFWGEMGRRFCPEIEDFPHRIKGTTLDNILGTYFPAPELQDYLRQAVVDYEAQMEYNLIAGAEDFLHDLKSHGVRLAVVTSSDQSKMANVWRSQRKFMEMFDAVLTSEDFAASKPSPDCYLKAAARLRVPTSGCIVFEDAFTGLAAGMNAGMFTVGLATGNPREAIRDKCNHVIDNYLGLGYRDMLALTEKV